MNSSRRSSVLFDFFVSCMQSRFIQINILIIPELFPVFVFVGFLLERQRFYLLVCDPLQLKPKTAF